MFDTFPALLLFAVAASITPGPNNFMLMQSGAAFGLRRTLPHIWGIDVGFGLLILAIGGGLAGLVVRAPGVFVALKWVGAAVLIALAYRIARPSPLPQSNSAEADGSRTGAAGGQPLSFAGAVAFQWVNPKAWLGALTGIVTFTVPTAYSSSAIVVAVTMMVVNLPCAALWTGLGTLLQRWLTDPWRRTAFNYAMAAMLVGSLYPMLRS